MSNDKAAATYHPNTEAPDLRTPLERHADEDAAAYRAAHGDPDPTPCALGTEEETPSAGGHRYVQVCTVHDRAWPCDENGPVDDDDPRIVYAADAPYPDFELYRAGTRVDLVAGADGIVRWVPRG